MLLISMSCIPSISTSNSFMSTAAGWLLQVRRGDGWGSSRWRGAEKVEMEVERQRGRAPAFISGDVAVD
jgi:hypothetical protein